MQVRENLELEIGRENQQVRGSWSAIAKPGNPLMKRTLLYLAILILCAIGGGVAVVTIFPMRHLDTIERYAAAYDLSPAFVAAIIHAESRFREGAVSHAQAKGLMQIMPSTGEWLAELLGIEGFTTDNLFEPETSIRMGSFYIRHLLDMNEQDTRRALAAYNAGTGNLRRWLADPELSSDGTTLEHIPFGETRTYVDRVMFNQRIYDILFAIRRIFQPILNN